ncbi:hypothetical protein GF336_02235 [Candidatus Woesearchaeota archaeon]|nr:hypothetical protein [Candidatus Woesearchaeota archaeon]
MMKKIMSFMMLIIMSSFVLGTIASKPVMISGSLEEQIDTLAGQYSGQEMPTAFKYIFGNERINVNIDELKFKVVTEDGKMTSFDKGHLEDPTINVYASKRAVNNIMNSDDKMKAVQYALDNNEITYEGTSFMKSTKLFFMGMAGKVASWFV